MSSNNGKDLLNVPKPDNQNLSPSDPYYEEFGMNYGSSEQSSAAHSYASSSHNSDGNNAQGSSSHATTAPINVPPSHVFFDDYDKFNEEILHAGKVDATYNPIPRKSPAVVPTHYIHFCTALGENVMVDYTQRETMGRIARQPGKCPNCHELPKGNEVAFNYKGHPLQTTQGEVLMKDRLDPHWLRCCQENCRRWAFNFIGKHSLANNPEAFKSHKIGVTWCKHCEKPKVGKTGCPKCTLLNPYHEQLYFANGASIAEGLLSRHQRGIQIRKDVDAEELKRESGEKFLQGKAEEAQQKRDLQARVDAGYHHRLAARAAAGSSSSRGGAVGGGRGGAQRGGRGGQGRGEY
ncbi:hypothetical protein B0T17DRAFT_506732 [Bombardia bombarda]|uniref:Uncharacterized protein n=1 Tax=Bombardia bombarda TaxID=252184 RepID=A0AA40C9L0_9PEZI|nr:hypothetical protein B0T17DRAFT_506732 [Bombardia bombarda]